MNFNRVNNIVGWIVCLIACTVYIMTMEATGSFWDCGEFVSSAYKLQIPHPPGAPLFVLLGRFFIILFGDDPTSAARGVNFMNAIASGFTILFLFWTITHFARKIVQKGAELLDKGQLFIVMAAGVVGALAYTFSDSFWYSAVEGEVYALSSFFTAIVFWAILKWEHEVDLESKTDGHKFSRADRWIIFIFFMMGLSIGVHLLNLLTIPAIVLVYYFKRYKVSQWGTFFAFLIGCVLTGIVQVVVIQWSIRGAGSFDIFFVNEMGAPFFVGFGVYFALLALLLIAGLRFNDASIRKFTLFPVWLCAIILLFCFPFIKSGGTFFLLLLLLGGVVALCYYNKERIGSFLKIGVWSTIFVILGYSTYFTTLVRSTANPSVDMYNVDNPVSLTGYLSRDQYGDWPILYGPDFVYRPPYVVTGDQYAKGEDKYEVVGKNRKQDYGAQPEQRDLDALQQQHPDWDVSKIGPHIFPRMYDNGNERNQEYVYRAFGGMMEGQQPTFGNNIRYFADYQFRWMYWRYFMWNFAGKQNDLQGFGNIRDGNWNSGITFIDKLFGHSTPDVLPATAGSENKANNKLFLLPFLLGVVGFIFQLNKTRRDFLVNFLLFFFTGFAIVIYLNQSGYQPRERDYAYVGSFYAFAVWIGLGVLWVKEKLQKFLSPDVAGYIAFGATLLAVPVLMASQEWDDHDRSKKVLARDLGKDYLESCAPNALLISFGDNDTYPLWYTQEVEGIRKDLRVVNYSLLGTDWYINQLRYKVNESPAMDVIFTPDQIQGSKRDITFTADYLRRGGYNNLLTGYDPNQYYDLYTVLKNVTASDAPNTSMQMDEESRANILPSNKVSIPVDVEAARKALKLNPGDSIVSELKLDIKKSYLYKNDLAVLALIAANNWKRPIYFTSTQELEDLGLEKYARMEGLSYRLVPIENSQIGVDDSYKNVMEKFVYGGAERPGVYFDEENRRHLNSIRQAHAFLGLHLAENGKKDSARNVLNKYDKNVLQENLPYGFTSNRGNFHNRVSMTFLLAALRSEDWTLADKVSKSLKRDLEQQMSYYRSLGDAMPNEKLAMEAAAIMNGRGGNLSDKQFDFANDILSSFQMLNQIGEWEKQFKPGGKGGSAELAPDSLSTPEKPVIDTTKP
ncbi:DUF2723 domain-containing protein [Pseudobacter ginsenosidimutans]|uniref:Uncharacterized protein DUF2723 n=1 Tax=Pseudobacter ginsenosidimutans TaxID=661488 RepID=A0A4Q7N3F7_9BACT|nr:DUF2723 domain-containing protein [Pseudobacter ginsenosidimutans]QEC43933.1 DUF2723 domain-containing protein [Pseudobacter ginsenosidimutans]RZS75365.1 uncharacterized protein DUF2723 [Pseudobacter ginsenosidimutans]